MLDDETAFALPNIQLALSLFGTFLAARTFSRHS